MPTGDVPFDGPPDAALVARVLAGGDRRAFAALLRRHQGPVRALLRRLTQGDEALADDLAQETFLIVHRKLAQFRGDARFSTWIYRIAYNAFLQHLREHKPTESLDEAAPVEDESAAGDVAAAAEQAHLQTDMARALQVLTPPERAAIAQCYYLDRSHEEAAYVLDCPVGTVKSHIFRAKAKLKQALAAWEPRVAT